MNMVSRMLKRVALVIIFVISTIAVVYAADDVLQWMENSKKYNYKHKFMPESKAHLSTIACSITEVMNDVYGLNVPDMAISSGWLYFSYNKDNQIYYEGEDIKDVYVFNDDIIEFTSESSRRENYKYPYKFRYNRIDRKNGVYTSRWFLRYEWDSRKYEGKGYGYCYNLDRQENPTKI